MAIDNHSKNSSHPSSITYLPLAYHYSSSLHLPPSSFHLLHSLHQVPLILSQTPLVSEMCYVERWVCARVCVCEAHRVSIPPLRDQSRCQMPGAHKKEHHAFQLTFSSSVPTHIRLTYLLPTTPAHCTTGFFSHTSRGMSASQGCFMSFIMLLDRGLEFMNTAFLCCRKYRINQSDLRINDNLSFATEFSRQGLIYGAENLQATFLSDKILKRVKLFNHALLT